MCFLLPPPFAPLAPDPEAHPALQLVKKGAIVFVQDGAGLGSGFTDEEYHAAGAKLVDAEDVWQQEMVHPRASHTPNAHTLP